MANTIPTSKNKQGKQNDKNEKARLRVTIMAAAITGTCALIAAFIHVWGNRSQQSDKKTVYEISGTVIDNVTHQGIGQAEVSIVGRTETCESEDNGNFHLAVNMGEAQPVRIFAIKKGYSRFDKSYTPPLGQVVIPLDRSIK